MSSKNKTDPIRASGGLLWREAPRGREIMVIHRRRYDDWTLPKGKLKDGERWDEAAVREVAEETGYQVRLGRFAGVTFYFHGDKPKVVLFWNMTPLDNQTSGRPVSDSPEEVDLVEWLTPEEALERLNYKGERRLVRSWCEPR